MRRAISWVTGPRGSGSPPRRTSVTTMPSWFTSRSTTSRSSEATLPSVAPPTRAPTRNRRGPIATRGLDMPGGSSFA